ncbi:MAG: response regulator [Phycisphaeraceae bacterium]
MSDSPPRLLVVDDDPDIRSNLRDILTDMSYDVDTAPDGPTAMKLIEQQPYDVALLDMKMPGMDGLELYRRIKQTRSGTVAIIVTAYAADESAQEAVQMGAWEVVAKPVELERLLSVIDDVVSRPLVIVVDDDPDLCQSLWDLLREKKYRVCVAHDVEQARQRLSERPYQVALIDMKLPAGEGGDVLEAVRRTNPDARTILITGYASELEQKVQQAMQGGADAVCYKPFDLPQLLATLNRFVGQEE